MPMLPKLKFFLDQHRVSYKILAHPEADTSQKIAALLHLSGKQLAKVVMVKTEEGFVMSVLPAHDLIDIGRLEKILGKKGTVRIATEEEVKNLLPDCDPGAVPPFGNLYDLPVYLDQRLTQSEEICFEAGTGNESVAVGIEDYRRVVSPKIAEFGRTIRARKAA